MNKTKTMSHIMKWEIETGRCGIHNRIDGTRGHTLTINENSLTEHYEHIIIKPKKRLTYDELNDVEYRLKRCEFKNYITFNLLFLREMYKECFQEEPNKYWNRIILIKKLMSV
jgi:hypothetical protein